MRQLRLLFDFFRPDPPPRDRRRPAPTPPLPPLTAAPAPEPAPPLRPSDQTRTTASPPAAPPATDLTFIRNDQARRYILRVLPDGTARVTIPRRGSRKEAERFAAGHQDWIARQRARRAEQARHPSRRPWQDGDTVLFHGIPTSVRRVTDGGCAALRFGDRLLPHKDDAQHPLHVVRDHLREEAKRTLPPRLLTLARAHGLGEEVTRVTIRNQRSRWGSCSSSGAISLNWRLIQMPEPVRDYVLLHELMHLHQPNHSRRFWKLVADVCPDFQDSRRWLRQHEPLLLGG